MKHYRMQIIRNIDFYTFCLLIFSFPFGKGLFLPVFAIWLVLSFISFFIHKDFEIIKTKRFLILPILFYFSYILSPTKYIDFKLYTSELLFYLPLILVPILYPSNRQIYNKNLTKLFWIFTIGCSSAALYYFIYAIYRSTSFVDGSIVFNPIHNYGWGNYIFSKELSYLIHPSYFALYILIALAFLGIKIKEWDSFSLKVKFSLIIVIILLVTCLAFLQSRAGLLSLGLLAITWLYRILITNRRYLVGVIILFIFIVSSFFIFSKFERFISTAKIFGLINQADDTLNVKREDPTTIRLWIWKSAASVIKENPIKGVGPSFVKEKLYDEYLRRDLVISASEKLNAHNQFLETFLGIGVIGFSLLLITILVPLWFAFKEKDWLFVNFLCLCFISFTFESMLERIAGIVFFAIFYTTLAQGFLNKSKINDFISILRIKR